MSLMNSLMLPLGTIAPSFTLVDAISGKSHSLNELRGKKGTVVMFICNHCPYVKHVQMTLVKVADDYQSKGVAFIAINANNVENYPEDAPDKMKSVAQKMGYSFPYLYDETQEVAKAYHAACTPDFFLFDQELKCVYRGQFDDARPGNGVPVTGHDLSNAIDNLLVGKPIDNNQKPSMGCSIKWKR